jgi:hypothetical protein
MASPEEYLFPFVIGSIVGVTGRKARGSIPELFGERTKFGYVVSANGKSMIADFNDSSPIGEYFARDISRFSSAAFQTVRNIGDSLRDKDDMAWSIVKAYYASFYAAHGLLRIFGESYSYFDRSHIKPISDIASVYSVVPAFPLSAGAYHIGVIAGGTAIEFIPERKGSGGAHEAFWNKFSSAMGNISNKVIASNAEDLDAASVFNQIEALRARMRKNNAPLQSWLSVIRNDVQYRHEHGLWLPCKIKRQSRDRMSRIISQWERNPCDIEIEFDHGDNLNEFLISCAYIISLLRNMLIVIAKKSVDENASFAKLGPLLLLLEYDGKKTAAARKTGARNG